MRPGKIWRAIEVRVDARASEAIEFALNQLDTLGTEISYFDKNGSDAVGVVGYFDEKPNEENLQKQLAEALRIYGFSTNVIGKIEWREVADKDWLAEWKNHWTPTCVGRFIIAAPWHELDDPDKIVIRIEPNMAFGTGTHETTQLCLAAIDESYKPELSFLDVGTGTGILAIAAARLATEVTENLEQGSLSKDVPIEIGLLRQTSSVRSVAKILACDTDNEAVTIARENAALNGVGDQIEFFTGPIDEKTETFDFVCANLTADVIIPILPLLIGKTRETLVLSGILREQEESILNALQPREAEKHLVTRLGEWISVAVRMG